MAIVGITIIVSVVEGGYQMEDIEKSCYYYLWFSDGAGLPQP
jgi:hypothetical protein